MQQFVIGALLGLPLLLWGFAQFRKSRAAAAWPTAPGWIVESTLTSEVSRGDQDNPDSVTYYPNVVYQYQVGGQLYQGNRIALVTRGYQHPQQAQTALAAYPAGSPRNVYYDPAQPQQAILEHGRADGVLLMSLGGLILAVVIAGAAS